MSMLVVRCFGPNATHICFQQAESKFGAAELFLGWPKWMVSPGDGARLIADTTATLENEQERGWEVSRDESLAFFFC
jgi:hypothetical protein